MSDLLDAFRGGWKKFALPDRRPVLLALSGGIDSMVLARLLLDACIPFSVAHCNFGLRGADSEADEQFVRSWAAESGITAWVKRFDTVGLATQGESIQMTARRIRYEWFGELRREADFAAVLTAHNANDVAETVLINLARGTGIAGLQGIPVRNGHVLRPLLFASRDQISAYAAAAGLAWREDSSNASEKYLRNAIRHKVLPVLEQLLPGAGERMAQTASRISGSLPIYRGALERIMKRLIEARGRDYYVPVRLLRKQGQLETLVYELFEPFGFGTEQLPGILSLLDAPSGKFLRSATHRIVRDRDFLIVTAADAETSDLIQVEGPDTLVRTRFGSLQFALVPVPAVIPSEPGHVLLDARDIRFPLILRTRREGDYFYPLGMGGKKKKLKRFLIDIKMPQPDKERVLVLEQAGRILWIVGARIDERFRVREDSREVLEVRFLRGE